METATTGAPPAEASSPSPIGAIREEFPFLAREVEGRPIAYLDSAASAQKPLAVIEALDRYNRHQHANVHRGVYSLSEEATELYEGARRRVAAHIAADPREIVFTRNATEAINLVAYAWGRANVGPGDRVLVSEMEHHSNLVPWQMLAAEVGAELDWAPITEQGRLDLDAYRRLLERTPKLVALTHVSNVLGGLNPVAELTRPAREAGAMVLIDGAQAAPKLALDMGAIGADFYALTGHKAYGPTGIGVLWGRFELLAEMGPFNSGGSMIRRVRRDGVSFADPPAKFEAGTPPIAQAIGLGVALEWMEAVGLEAILAHEEGLAAYALELLAEVRGLRILGPPPSEGRIGPVSFELDGVHPHDVAQILDRHGVFVRAGHHCAQPLMERLEVTATTRASFGVYSTRGEVDRLAEGLEDVRRVFEL